MRASPHAQLQYGRQNAPRTRRWNTAAQLLAREPTRILGVASQRRLPGIETGQGEGRRCGDSVAEGLLLVILDSPGRTAALREEAAALLRLLATVALEVALLHPGGRLPLGRAGGDRDLRLALALRDEDGLDLVGDFDLLALDYLSLSLGLIRCSGDSLHLHRGRHDNLNIRLGLLGLGLHAVRRATAAALEKGLPLGDNRSRGRLVLSAAHLDEGGWVAALKVGERRRGKLWS
mmetsp:Transcript_142/g.355  ORF Transcript_142/g.355 Transcript_142/m.355 type:complete len:234 (+) Transcript_142:44-745(+)